MLINADCTVYEKVSGEKHYIPDVYWNDSRGVTVSKNGIQVADSVIVYIYDTDYIPKNEDIIVKGNSDFSFDASSQRAASESMKQLREQHPDFAVIKNVRDARFGGLPHIELTAR